MSVGICVKVHRSGKELLVAACDSEIIGRTYTEGKLRIHLSRDFYGGDAVEEDVFVNRLEIATIANLVGKRTIDMAVKHGFVDPECILVIDGVPHAQMARMI
ncbi:MAG: DUF424 family protein [Methanobacteriota archaeon]|nr:MAG: DUF424 family protein [Euryarchaeota archaeon]